MLVKKTVNTVACAATVMACALAGTGVQPDAYARGAAVVEVSVLDRIPDGDDAGSSDVEYVVTLHV